MAKEMKRRTPGIEIGFGDWSGVGYVLRKWEGPELASKRGGGSRSFLVQKFDGVRNALRRHLDQDLPAVMETITRSLQQSQNTTLGESDEGVKEAEAACRCAESWIGYGLGGE